MYNVSGMHRTYTKDGLMISALGVVDLGYHDEQTWNRRVPKLLGLARRRSWSASRRQGSMSKRPGELCEELTPDVLPRRSGPCSTQGVESNQTCGADSSHSNPVLENVVMSSAEGRQV